MEILIREHEPEKLILFGSAAQGEIHEWSDLDLVVIKRTDKPLLERIEEVLRLVRPKVGLDVLVYTPEEMEELIAERRVFVLGGVIFKGAEAHQPRPSVGRLSGGGHAHRPGRRRPGTPEPTLPPD